MVLSKYMKYNLIEHNVHSIAEKELTSINQEQYNYILLQILL